MVAGNNNVSAFATSRAILAGGGVVAVFPEGISHDQFSIQPLKTGAAVNLSSSSWAGAQLYSGMAEVVVRSPGTSPPTDIEFADKTEVASRLAAVAQGNVGARRAAVRDAFAIYRRDLDVLGLNDTQLTAGYPRGRLRLGIAWSLLTITAGSPLAAIGVRRARQFPRRPVRPTRCAMIK